MQPQHLCVLCLQRSSVIGRTMHCGGSKSSGGCCGQPGLWRNMASTLMPSCFSCSNTNPWICASRTASLWGSEHASPAPSLRLWWASAQCSVSQGHHLTSGLVSDLKSDRPSPVPNTTMGTHLHAFCDMRFVTPLHYSSVILGSVVQPFDFKYCGCTFETRSVGIQKYNQPPRSWLLNPQNSHSTSQLFTNCSFQTLTGYEKKNNFEKYQFCTYQQRFTRTVCSRETWHSFSYC